MLFLAFPLIVSTASWSVMNFIDRLFLSWYDPTAMAATLPSGILHFTLVCFPLGIATYVNTFVAQYQGANRPLRIGVSVWQGVWIGVACIPFFLMSIPLAPWFFHGIGHEPALARMETLYYQSVAWCAGAEIISGAMSSFFTGRRSMKAVMIVDCTASGLNVFLAYAWVFGKCGFPEWGICGAAWATVLSQWFRVAAYIFLLMRRKYRVPFGILDGMRYDRTLMARLLRYGLPNGLQMFIELASFTLFTLLVGQLGEKAMAATTLAMNVNTLAFMPIVGLGIAVSTAVGHQLGQGDPRMAERAAWSSFKLGALYMGTMAAIYVLFPKLILMFHAAGSHSPGEFEEVRHTTVVLLRFVAAYCLFDAMNMVFVSVLKGAGDTRFIFYTTSVLAPLVVGAVWFGTHLYGLGLMWCWIVLTVWVCVLGWTYWLRFQFGPWRAMRVIEPDIVREEENEGR